MKRNAALLLFSMFLCGLTFSCNKLHHRAFSIGAYRDTVNEENLVAIFPADNLTIGIAYCEGLTKSWEARDGKAWFCTEIK